MRAVFLFLMAGIFYGQQVNAQLLKKLGDKVKQTTDKAADKIFGGGSKEAPGSQDAAAAGNEAKPMVSATKADLSAYGSYDFVPGDSVIFSDELTEDDLNEVPAKWLMEKGRGEVITHEDELVISTRAGTTLTPRMKNKNSYLPARFTIEFDVKFLNYNPSYGRQLTLQLANPPLDNNQDGGVYAQHAIKVWASGEAGFATSEGKWPFEHFDAANVAAMKQWKHIAIAVNEKGVKVYVNQFRILNAQVEFGKPSTLRFTTGGDYDAPVLIKNFRILAGGKNAARQITTQNLYIARGILFERASPRLLPESMGEINTMVKIMKDDPNVKFEIGGHTSQEAGSSAEANQKLSEERAQAVRNKMIEMGIEASRLSAKGYGQNNPIAPNDTPEGRASNRRVEFKKL